MDELDPSKLRKAFRNAQWADPKFSTDKAYVMLYFSSLAYETLSGLQLDRHRRVNLFFPLASGLLMAFERARAVILKQKFESDMGGGEDLESKGEFFVILRDDVHIVGLVRPDVIILALRGTKAPRDFLVDANSLQAAHVRRFTQYRFHLGFYNAIVPWFDSISLKIHLARPIFQIAPPIYVTGHSLGGAMAGITNLLDPFFVDVKGSPVRASITGCYTFGMPRFGNHEVMSAPRWPFHIYHEKDVIPGVPPTSIGYGLGRDEYLLDDNNLIPVPNRRLRMLDWWKHLVTVQFSEHMPAVYRRRLGARI